MVVPWNGSHGWHLSIYMLSADVKENTPYTSHIIYYLLNRVGSKQTQITIYTNAEQPKETILFTIQNHTLYHPHKRRAAQTNHIIYYPKSHPIPSTQTQSSPNKPYYLPSKITPYTIHTNAEQPKQTISFTIQNYTLYHSTKSQCLLLHYSSLIPLGKLNSLFSRHLGSPKKGCFF
jgi:hypothetical protein